MRYIFPVAIVVLFGGAGIVAAIRSEWNAAIYSFFAAGLNAIVYFRPFAH